jgi:glycosyltransferase involved in cell wall biosynthesis
MNQELHNDRHIAIDIRILGKKRTGDETVFFELTREVLRQDTTSRYSLLTNESDPEALELLRARLGIDTSNIKHQIVVLPATNRFRWNLFTLPRYLQKAKIDVFHTQYILPFWVPRATRVVNHIHDVSFCAFPELINPKDLFFLRLLIPRSLRRSDTIITPSEFTKNEIVKYYGTNQEKIVVIHNAVGSDFGKQSEGGEAREAQVRTEYHLPDKYILYVGTLQPRKNIPFLIRAFAEYQKQSPQMKLVLVGSRTSHHFDQGIDSAIEECGVVSDVIFPGYVAEEDLPLIYQMASAFVFPSLYEGFGIPLLEAMSVGTPVVASNQPCLMEVGGEAALYFEQGHIDSLAHILYSLEVTNAQKESLREKGFERVREFSWHKSGTKLVQEYHAFKSASL